MPLADAAFLDPDGRPDHASLIEFGPSLEVVVSTHVDPKHAPTEGHTTHALVDTGATQSCIDMQLAQTLGLPVVDFVMTGSALRSPSRATASRTDGAMPARRRIQRGEVALLPYRAFSHSTAQSSRFRGQP